MSKLQDKEKAASIDILKKSADKAKEQYSKDEITTKDVILAIVKVLLSAAFAYIWALSMLLIASFVTLGYLHFNFDKMLIWSGVFAFIIAVFVSIGLIRKFTKATHL